MKRTWLNYTIDVIMFFAFICIFCTGLFKFPGLLSALGVNLRAIPIAAVRIISSIHDYAGLTLLVSMLLHLILHLKWMGKMTAKLFRRKKNEETDSD